MKEREWATAAFPEETAILSLRLRPYSCGHEITLCQMQSPFVTGNREPTLPDLMMAALVCSQSFADGQKLLRDPKGGGWQVTLWRWLALRHKNPFAEELKFTEYLNRGAWSPATARSREKGWVYRELKAPRVWRLIPFLCRNLGLTESEALDFPLARANAYFAAEADREGTIELASEAGDNTQDGQLLAHLKNLEERAAKGEPVWDF